MHTQSFIKSYLSYAFYIPKLWPLNLASNLTSNLPFIYLHSVLICSHWPYFNRVLWKIINKWPQYYAETYIKCGIHSPMPWAWAVHMISFHQKYVVELCGVHSEPWPQSFHYSTPGSCYHHVKLPRLTCSKLIDTWFRHPYHPSHSQPTPK